MDLKWVENVSYSLRGEIVVMVRKDFKVKVRHSPSISRLVFIHRRHAR